VIDGLKPYPNALRAVPNEPWLGAVPPHWTLIKLKHILAERNERGYPAELLLAATQTKGVVLKSDYGARTVEAMKDLHLLKLVRVGDFVISLRSFQGGIEFARTQGIISPAYTILYPRDTGAHGYLAALFKSRSFIGNLTLYVTGIRQGQNIDYTKLARSYIPLPPPAEQEGIVRFLGAGDRKVNRFIRDKRRLIEVLTEQKQAIITQAVTKGLDPHAPLKPSGIDWLGDVPAHWEVKRLRHIIEGRLTYGANEAAEHDRTDWPRYLRITDFGGDGSLRADTFRSLPSEIAADYMVQPGDILLARSGATVGKAFLVDERAINACHAGYLIRARPKQAQANPRFLFLYTQSTAYASWRAATFSIATIENIGADKYANLPVPLPPRDEQDEILKGLAEVLKPIEGAAAVARREIDLIREYRTRLVADVVTGKVDVRSVVIPADDPQERPDGVEPNEEVTEDEEEAAETLDG
jgi:type I restriction enzyme S subunit